MRLHPFESHESTRLALQVVEQGSQGDKLFAAAGPGIWAMVDLLHMHGRVEMLIQSGFRSESTMADVTLPGAGVTVVGAVRGGVMRIPFLGPADQLLRDGSARVTLADQFVEFVAVHARRLGARPSLQMMRHATGGGEAGLAERTGNIRAAMNLRVEVLYIKLDESSCFQCNIRRQSECRVERYIHLS